MSNQQNKVLIIAEHASSKFGGEAILPVHYFRVLRKRGAECWMIVHDRTRAELTAMFPDDLDRISFVPDTSLHKSLLKLGRRLPHTVSYFTLGMISRLSTQRIARSIAARLIREHGIDVVHQPIPVAAGEPSTLHKLRLPLVIGPLNGGMTYPPAFGGKDDAAQGSRSLRRLVSDSINRMAPGKLKADMVLVANERTRKALPSGVRGEVIELVENGVDLELWSAPEGDRAPQAGPTRFLFIGRMVDWKAVDVLIDALHAAVQAGADVRLDLLGDGPMRAPAEEQVARLGLAPRVTFHGWIKQSECPARLREADALVLPSLYECGGAVVLEAMACGIPAIATEWGGPADYLDESCGILVPPTSREALVSGFAAAMKRLAADPELRRSMGRNGRQRILDHYDWERKVDRIQELYAQAIGHHRGAAAK
ncbi:glycosyltransferase family 4 protein [Isosphaeraceae bacterium EP7]